MSKTTKRYIVKDAVRWFAPVPPKELKGQYTTDVSKSHERKVIKRGILPPPEK